MSQHDEKRILRPGFFESDPAADEIRNLTLEGIHAYNQVILARSDATALGEAVRRIQEAGIVPGMNAVGENDPDREAKRRELRQNPLQAAQWAAGFFLAHVAERSDLDVDRTHIHEEHDESQGRVGGIRVFDSAAVPQMLKDDGTGIIELGILEMMLRPEDTPEA